MNTIFKTNVNTSEQGRRYIIGAAILGLLLTNPTMPAWIALVACYPIFTALVQWDPINTVMQAAINRFKHKNSMTFGKTTTA
ncbi:MAG: DUF2892 domain-containing protein [Gammaproteobacteria bacterium]|jgi:hypothetical protein|nr:DUF2892 domain-containing protein [Gammaproteobacteria bacterium]